MPAGEYRVLAINPGSTSTKIALYSGSRPDFVENLRHSDAELAPFRGCPILEQQQFRCAKIEAALSEAGHNVRQVDAVVGRGGLLPALASGTYVVNEEMLEDLRLARRGEHAANLGAFLAYDIAQKAGVPAYVVDPVSVDEWPECARLSGSALLERQCLSHALNSKAVAKRYAREHGQQYESLHLIVAHMGSGISASAHENGLMVDVTNSREEGAFSTERAGGVPVMQLVDLCFSGQYTEKQVEGLLFREGGLYSYLGTKDLAEVEHRIDDGEAKAKTAFDAMVYQIAKEIGAMAAVLHGRVNAVLLTGGMAHSQRLVARLSDCVSWIAPVTVYPGEDELQALTEGALRVLRQEEQPKTLALGCRALVKVQDDGLKDPNLGRPLDQR
ncbi:MAG: butyrate kinase [Acidobacteriota bacterium]|nr:butyrate kinase [Acidobacteriota bacterium]